MTCTTGSANVVSNFLHALSYFMMSLPMTFMVQSRSSLCELPVTPIEDTFQIWGSIYTQTSTMYLPFTLTRAERHHLNNVNQYAYEWYSAFVRQENNSLATTALGNMACHLEGIRASRCKSGTTFACCAVTQYHTWVVLAATLSASIHLQYGDSCQERRGADDEQVEAYFAALFCEAVHTVDSYPSTSRDAALATLAWAYSGICEKRGVCLSLPCNDMPLPIELQRRSREPRSTLWHALSCI